MMLSEQPNLNQALMELQRRYPNWRFGQLVANVAGWADVDVWDVEDQQLLAAALSHLEELDRPLPECVGSTSES